MGQGRSPVSILLSLAPESTQALKKGPQGLAESWKMSSKTEAEEG